MSFEMCTCCFSSIYTTMQRGNNTSLFAVHVQPLSRIFFLHILFCLYFIGSVFCDLTLYIMYFFYFLYLYYKIWYFLYFFFFTEWTHHWADSVSVAMSVSRVCVCVCHRRKPASRWTGDFWLKNVLLILAYFWTFLCFCRCNNFLYFDFF